MRGGIALSMGVVATGCVVMLLAGLARDARPVPGPIPPPLPVVRPFDPYDSIRTDLDDYTWPLPSSRIVTSTFGEYRRTHYHAGIDISTGDATGFPVVASRDGEVERIRVEANGYGKMLYIRHADGYQTTYAHLRAFAGAIERRARAEQTRAERYPVDILCAPGELRVRKGETVAYSGDTGTGSEHLHFEIRDEHENAVNPFLAPGLRNPDRLPPRFLRLALLPIGIESRIEGSSGPRTFLPHQTGPRAYRIATPIRIVGRAGFAVYVRDRSDGSRFSNGVYRHRLVIDGNEVFDLRLDRVPVSESQQIAFSTARDFPGAGGGRFEKLFVDGLHTLPFYSNPTEGAGEVSAEVLPPGSHSFAITSQDFAGNSAELTGTFIIHRPETVAPSPDRENGGGPTPAVTAETELTPHGIRAALHTGGEFTKIPVVTIEEGGRRRTLPMTLLDLHRAEALVIPDDTFQGYRSLLFQGNVNGAPFKESGGISCYAILPGRRTRIRPVGTELLLECDSCAVFDTTYLQVTQIPSADGPWFELSPEGGLLRDGIAVTLPRFSRSDGKEAIYTRRTATWSLTPGRKLNADGSVSGRLTRWIGDLWLARDTIPPVIHSLRLSNGGSGVPLARFRFSDQLSGVDYQSLATYIDGKFVIPDIDGEHRRAVVPAPTGLTRGSHRLTIRLSDQLGNTSILERRFAVP
jgi:hypothetical protein